MDKALKPPALSPGQLVEVTHLQGVEVGEVDSVNYKTGKVLVFFNYDACPHFTSFNLSQVKPIKPKLVREEKPIAEQIETMSSEEKINLADRIYNHILGIMDHKIQGK